MIVAFTGAHSTGKSTLVEFFRGKEGFVCIDSVTRSTISAKERKVDGVEDLGEAQLKIADSIGKAMENIVKMNAEDPGKVYLMDRCVFDFLAYTEAFRSRGMIKDYVVDDIKRRCEGLWKYIDIFYYLPIEFDIVDDGVRSLDNSLRQDVDQNVLGMLLWNKVRAVKLTGPVLSRVNTIKRDIENLQ